MKIFLFTLLRKIKKVASSRKLKLIKMEVWQLHGLVVSLKKGLMSFSDVLTTGITDSYINSLNLEDNTSSRNFYDR